MALSRSATSAPVTAQYCDAAALDVPHEHHAMRWSKPAAVASSTVSKRPEAHPFLAGAHLSPWSVNPTFPVIRLYGALWATGVDRLDQVVERVGVAVADQHDVAACGRCHAEQLARQGQRQVGAERLEVGVDEPEPVTPRAHVDPLVAAVEAQRRPGDVDGQVVGVVPVPLSTTLPPRAAPGSRRAWSFARRVERHRWFR